MKTYTEQEFFDWIKEQPEERPVAMTLSTVDTDKGYGCIMTEFMRDKGAWNDASFMFIKGRLGYRFDEPDAVIEFEAESLLGCMQDWDRDRDKITNVGTFKKCVSDKYKEKYSI